MKYPTEELQSQNTLIIKLGASSWEIIMSDEKIEEKISVEESDMVGYPTEEQLQETAKLIQEARGELSEIKNEIFHYNQIIGDKFSLICQHYLDQIGVLSADLIWDKNGKLSINPDIICIGQPNIIVEKKDESIPLTMDNIKKVEVRVF
jgi:hypothetical protein